MTPGTDLLTRNVQLLKSRVNRYGVYGLVISLSAILVASAMVSLQLTGAISLRGMVLAHQDNFALRLLDLLPFAFTIWGQYTGTVMAYHASAMILEQTDDLRAETTAWKKKSHHDATHDPLTSLPNRAKFYDIVQQAIHSCSREERAFAILFADLDGFREINEAFGPQNGDLILKQVAARLQGLIPETDPMARMGGDEFAILLQDVPSENVPGSRVPHPQGARSSLRHEPYPHRDFRQHRYRAVSGTRGRRGLTRAARRGGHVRRKAHA